MIFNIPRHVPVRMEFAAGIVQQANGMNQPENSVLL